MIMAKSKGFRQTFRETYAETRAEQAAKQARRRAEKEKEGPAGVRAWNAIVRWTKRAFFTVFFVMAVYLVIMIGAFSLPSLLAIVIGSLGYTLASMVELMLAALCGLFFTLWMFAISAFFVTRFWKVYKKAMLTTMKSRDDNGSKG